MNASEFVLLLFVVRLVIPFGGLILFGEWVRRQNANYWLKK
ncbi:MAG: hypothetical protein U0Z26_07125 [Anaerolineales bacterium]